MLFLRNIDVSFCKGRIVMTGVTVTMSPEHMAAIMNYAERQNSDMYTELVRGSNIHPSTKELVNRVADYCNGRPAIDDGLLRERVKALAETYAKARRDNAVDIFHRISGLYPGTTETEIREQARTVVQKSDEQSDQNAQLAYTSLFRLSTTTLEQAIDQTVACLRPYIKRVETMRGILAEAAENAGITLAAPPYRGILGGATLKPGVTAQPA
jgi:hypothetical protein